MNSEEMMIWEVTFTSCDETETDVDDDDQSKNSFPIMNL